jgi:diguanylate cyclase (GGDEF)-like protein
MIDPSTNDLDDTTVDLDDTKPRSSETGELRVDRENGPTVGDEANLILIAHPENRQLGKRFRLTQGSNTDIGRNKSCDLGFPEVMSLSRNHGRLNFDNEGVSIEDLGSTNGSFVNDRRVQGRVYLTSGDRIQLGALHFKFLRGRDVEHAYYEAIYHLMTQDGLTEIYNRRSFDDEFQREFSRSKRHHRPLSLILFDVDHFKLVNDRCGHLCGDFVLKGVVNIARKLLRTEQVFARVGGDEFAILTPETGAGNATILAEKLRSKIAGHEFDPDLLEGTVRATCSFGVAELNDGMSKAEDFFSAADEALYESKSRGRNRITVHDPDGAKQPPWETVPDPD